jgi:hypothetical protein
MVVQVSMFIILRDTDVGFNKVNTLLAQLVARFVDIEKVAGSNPAQSTMGD